MGYYVKIKKSNVVFPAKNLPTILQIWKDLNKPENDAKKNGGSYKGGECVEKWYSWMEKDYDKTCNSVEEVLYMLGFDTDTIDNGDVLITGYDSKTGQEDLFFEAVRDYITGTITWQGEEGETFKWKFQKELPIDSVAVCKSLGLLPA